MPPKTEDRTTPASPRRRLTWKEMFTSGKGPRNKVAEAIIVVAILLMVVVTVLQAFGVVPHTPRTAYQRNPAFTAPLTHPEKPKGTP